VGDRVGALTVWGADAERVCVPEKYAVKTPEELDPAEIVSLIFPYMTAYQMLHRTAQVRSGETVLVHGAAGRVGTAALELGALAGLRLIGTASARDRGAVEQLGAVFIDYQHEDFLARVRELTNDGVDVVLDGIGGPVALRSFRALRVGNQITGDPGGRLVTMGNYNTMVQRHKNWRGWVEWYPAMATVWLWGMLSTRRRLSGYRIQMLRIPHQDWFEEDFHVLLELLRDGKIHPVVAERLPLSEARRAHELLEGSAAKGKLVLVP
jgi:NADPH2:quinone reductase